MLQVRLEADADVVREREQVAALHAEVRRRLRFVVALVRAARHAQVRDLKAKLHTAQHEAARLADTDTQRQIARLKADHADELAQLRALHENALAAVRPPWGGLAWEGPKGASEYCDSARRPPTSMCAPQFVCTFCAADSIDVAVH